MVIACDLKRELLWDVLKESVALGEHYYGSGEQRDYFEDLGMNLGFLCHHYLNERDGGTAEEQRDPFVVLKRFFEGMGDTIFTASMETGHFVAQLHAPSTSLLFSDKSNCEAFLAGFAGSLAAQRFGFCTVKIRQEKKTRAFFISVSASRAGEHSEGSAYHFHRDSIFREKPSSYSLIVSTLNFLLKKQGVTGDPIESTLDSGPEGMNDRKFKLFAIILRMAMENDRAGRKNTELMLGQQACRERVEEEKEKLKEKESECDSLKGNLRAMQADFSGREREYLGRMAELEDTIAGLEAAVAQARIDLLDRDAALEEAQKEIIALNDRKASSEKQAQQRGIEELFSVMERQKESLAFMARALTRRVTWLARFRPLLELPALNTKKEEMPDPAREPGILDAYHYHLMDYCELLEEENRNLRHSGFIDEVTGSFNARYLMRRLEEELNRVKRHRRNLSIVKIGINNLHHIIQSYDENMGNKVLLEITKNMRESLRNIDIITRTGDDEFVILLPETDLEHALQVAQRISENLRSLSICSTQSSYIHVSVSGSVLCFDDYELPGTELIRVAEEILLHGKRVNLGSLRLKEVHAAPVLYIN